MYIWFKDTNILGLSSRSVKHSTFQSLRWSLLLPPRRRSRPPRLPRRRTPPHRPPRPRRRPPRPSSSGSWMPRRCRPPFSLAGVLLSNLFLDFWILNFFLAAVQPCRCSSFELSPRHLWFLIFGLNHGHLWLLFLNENKYWASQVVCIPSLPPLQSWIF